jgi:hypothetical protein
VFELSFANFLLANVPRVFLGSKVPGFVSSQETVCLPLTLDGELTDTGISADNRTALDGFLRDRSRFFASFNPEIVSYRSEEAYRAAVQPPWLQALARRIDRTLRSYEGSSSPHSFLDRWSQIQGLISATLFMGAGEIPHRCFMLFSQDLSLYARDIEPAEVSLTDLIEFLGTYLHVSALLATGMVDQIRVLHDSEERGKKQIYDAFSEKSLVPRPRVTLRADREGRIDPMASLTADVHPAYDLFQNAVEKENEIFLNHFLVAFQQSGV